LAGLVINITGQPSTHVLGYYRSSLRDLNTSPRTHIPADEARGRKQPLKKLERTGAESPRAAEQVVAPPALEALTVMAGEARPGGLEVALPGPQRAVVVGAEVVHVLHDEEALRGVGDLGGGRQQRVGENVARNPRVGNAG